MSHVLHLTEREMTELERATGPSGVRILRQGIERAKDERALFTPLPTCGLCCETVDVCRCAVDEGRGRALTGREDYDT